MLQQISDVVKTPNIYSQIFILLHLPYINSENRWKRFSQKKLLSIFFQLEIVVDKTTFSSLIFYKMNDCVSIQNVTTGF